MCAQVFANIYFFVFACVSDCADMRVCVRPRMHAHRCLCVFVSVCVCVSGLHCVGSAPAVWAMWRRMYQGVRSWQLAGREGVQQCV